MDKYLCERCGKELVFRCAYSRIDHKLICIECDDKEQPKELMKKIQELEAKLEEKEKEETKRMQDFEKGCQEYYSSDKYKKDFAIAELQRVLKTMEEKQFYKKEDTAYCVHPAQIAEYVLKQIKELKGKK